MSISVSLSDSFPFLSFRSVSFRSGPLRPKRDVKRWLWMQSVQTGYLGKVIFQNSLNFTVVYFANVECYNVSISAY